MVADDVSWQISSDELLRQTMSGCNMVASDVVAAHVVAVSGLFACFVGSLSLDFLSVGFTLTMMSSQQRLTSCC